MKLLTNDEITRLEKDYDSIKSSVNDIVGKKILCKKFVITSLTGCDYDVTLIMGHGAINIGIGNMEASVVVTNQTTEDISMTIETMLFAMLYKNKDITSAVIDYLIKSVIKAVPYHA